MVGAIIMVDTESFTMASMPICVFPAAVGNTTIPLILFADHISMAFFWYDLSFSLWDRFNPFSSVKTLSSASGYLCFKVKYSYAGDLKDCILSS